jgi:hypothetical protein
MVWIHGWGVGWEGCNGTFFCQFPFVQVLKKSIDQLDKADAPPIPESYIYLLTLQSLSDLLRCNGGRFANEHPLQRSTYRWYGSVLRLRA